MKAKKEKTSNSLSIRSASVSEFYMDSHLAKAICDGLSKGRDIRATCEAVGVDKPSFDRAMKEGYRCLLIPYKGRTPEQNSVAEFYCLAKEAVRDFEETNVAVIRKAAKMGDWKASAWLLERRLPEVYGKHELQPIAKEREQTPAIEVKIVDSSIDSARMERLSREVLDEIDGKPSPYDAAPTPNEDGR